MGVLGNNYYSGLRIPTTAYVSSGSRASTPLNAAYSPGVSGTALGVRYQARTTQPITKILLFLEAVAGTFANITMACNMYAEHATLVSAPGATLRATGVVTKPSAALKWFEVNFPTPYSPSAVGETIWFVISNTSSAPTVDYPSILTGTNCAPGLNGGVSQNDSGLSSTVGFSANGSSLPRVPRVIVQGGVSYGQPITTNNNTVFTSNLLMKGFQIKPPCDIEVSGWMTGNSGSNLTGMRIYDAAVPPTGTPLFTYALGTDALQIKDELIGAKTFAPIVLNAGKTYNVVSAYGQIGTVSGGLIEDYVSFPTLFDGLRDDFFNCMGVWDVANAWSLRSDFFPGSSLMVTGFPQPAASGIRKPKVWNGTAWVEKTLGVWNGSAWVEQDIEVWNGSAWVGGGAAPPSGPTSHLGVSYTPGTDRNDFTGQVGVRLGIGASPFTVSWVGARSNGIGGTRTVKLYEWFADALQFTATLDFTGVPVGTYVWKAITPITLPASSYYALLMDVVASDGNTWKNPGPTVFTGMANVYDCYRVPGSGLSTGGVDAQFVGLDLGW